MKNCNFFKFVLHILIICLLFSLFLLIFLNCLNKSVSTANLAKSQSNLLLNFKLKLKTLSVALLQGMPAVECVFLLFSYSYGHATLCHTTQFVCCIRNELSMMLHRDGPFDLQSKLVEYPIGVVSTLPPTPR